jgi:phage protein U
MLRGFAMPRIPGRTGSLAHLRTWASSPKADLLANSNRHYHGGTKCAQIKEAVWSV